MVVFRAMESGPPTPDRPRDDEPAGGQPAAEPDPTPPAPPPGPQAPQAPPPGPPAPQAPPPGPQAPGGLQAPPPGPPAGPQAPGGPESPAGYGGPVPPGGWQQPIARPQGWGGTPLAGWWSRVGAAILDGLILLIPVAILIAIVVGVFAASDVGGVVTAIIAFLAYIAVSILYAPVLVSRQGEHNGQTWGKQIVGIRVVRDTGEPVELGYGFLREIVVKAFLFGFLGGFLASIPTILDWLWPLWDDENRCLHDMLVKSHVVKA
jgi:uncharacterized RDD family membrane protein YckC